MVKRMEISCSHCFLSKLDKQEGRVHWNRWYVYWSRKAAVVVMVSLGTFCFASLKNAQRYYKYKIQSVCLFLCIWILEKTHPILLRSITQSLLVSFPHQSKRNTNKNVPKNLQNQSIYHVCWNCWDKKPRMMMKMILFTSVDRGKGGNRSPKAAKNVREREREREKQRRITCCFW